MKRFVSCVGKPGNSMSALRVELNRKSGKALNRFHFDGEEASVGWPTWKKGG